MQLDIYYYINQLVYMRILELLCNPRLRSFNHAIAARARERLDEAGHEVFFHDLYEEGFDPVLDAAELARGFSLDSLVQAHCRQLAEADGLVVVHPLWWCGPPALLKGWMDRVLRQGVAYDLEGGEFSEKDWKPLLSGKRGLALITSDEDSPEAELEARSIWGRSVLGKCGMDSECGLFGGLRTRSAAEKTAWMASLDSRLARVFPATSKTHHGDAAFLMEITEKSKGENAKK